MPMPRRATTADLGDIIDVLARAFTDDPMHRWMFQQAGDYDRANRRLVEFFARAYFAVGNTYVDDGGRGAALWSPPDLPGITADNVGNLIEVFHQEIPADDAADKLGQMAEFEARNPREPHFHLGMVGVDPAAQGRGHGAALLDPVVRMIEAEGHMAALEASNPRHVGFYERLGFEIHSELRLDDGAGPLITFMRRLPG